MDRNNQPQRQLGPNGGNQPNPIVEADQQPNRQD